MTGVKPKLTPFAAFDLALVMILAAVFHLRDFALVDRASFFVASVPITVTTGCERQVAGEFQVSHLFQRLRTGRRDSLDTASPLPGICVSINLA